MIGCMYGGQAIVSRVPARPEIGLSSEFAGPTDPGALVEAVD